MKLLVVLAVAGCTASELPPVRFANSPPITLVNDRKEVTAQPASRMFLPNVYFFDSSVHLPIDRGLSLPRQRRALGVAAVDEVPDSTWFTNRIGSRPLTPAEIERGPVTHDPSAHLPWAIQSTKTGGTTAGFIVKDAAGEKYILKFDYAGDPPELETGTHVICNRLMWALGYNVAEDQILYIHRKDLTIGEGAKKKDELGATLGLLTEKDVEELMKGVRKEDDGRIRVIASRYIAGTPIGGFPGDGTRLDDPNDIIPHELRRDLRGMLPIDAWLDAVDVTEGQFVDAYVDDHGRHYVKHYSVDFGKSLGAMGLIAHDWWRGYAYRVDWPKMLHALVTLGFSERWWEYRDGPTTLRGVSNLFDVGSFQPRHWHPDTPGFVAFHATDRFDQFWGTALVAQFTRPLLEGAVAAGKLSEPRSARYLVDTLLARQRVLAATWFAEVNPLVHFATSAPRAVCFDDLAISLGLAGTTRYVVSGYDFDGAKHAATVTWVAERDGHTCIPHLPVSGDHEGYTIYRIVTERASYAGTTYVHVALQPKTGATRIVGVWRP
ncbi:MAG: hypothetical protein ABI678_01745 [Kofleriaceae bacterium]